jgi:hypothetical protein
LTAVGGFVNETFDVDERDEIDEDDDCCGWPGVTFDLTYAGFVFPNTDDITEAFGRGVIDVLEFDGRVVGFVE